MSETPQARAKRSKRWNHFEDALYSINARLASADRRYLAQLVLDADRFNQTNCSWAAYAIGPLVRKMASDELRRRDYERSRRARKAVQR